MIAQRYAPNLRGLWHGGCISPFHHERELVTALVGSEDFRFNACRLAFEFLYGREETTCEAGSPFGANPHGLVL